MISEKKAVSVLRKSGILEIKQYRIVPHSAPNLEIQFVKKLFYLDPRITSRWCNELARLFVKEDARVVAGLGDTGLTLAQWTAIHLMNFYQSDSKRPSNDVQNVTIVLDASKRLVLSPGDAKYIRGKLVLVVTDCIDDPEFPIQEIEKVVQSAGGIMVGLGSIVRTVENLTEDLDNVAKINSVVDRAAIEKYLEY